MMRANGFARFRSMKYLFITAILLPQIIMAQQQWQPVDMPGNGRMRNVYLSSDHTLFALDLNDFGFVRSQSDESWQAVYPEEDSNFGEIMQRRDTLISAKWDRGSGTLFVYRSADFGFTWDEVRNEAFVEPWSSLEFFASNGVLYYSIEDTAVFVSEDYGESWQRPLKDLESDFKWLKMAVSTAGYHYLTLQYKNPETGGYDEHVFRINKADGSRELLDARLTDVNDVYENRVYTASSQFPGNIYYIGPEDTLWQETSMGAFEHGRRGEDFLEVIDGVIYTKAGLSGQDQNNEGIFYGSEGDTAWQIMGDQLPRFELYDIAGKPDMMAAASHSGVFISQDGGDSWQARLNGLPVKTQASDFGPFNKRLYVSTGYGVYVRDKMDKDWRFDHHAMSGHTGNKMIEVNDTLYIYNGEDVYRKVHPDSAWRIPYDVIVEATTIQFRGCPVYYNNTLFIGGLFGLYGSTDGGESWQNYNDEARAGFEPVFYYGTEFEDDLIVYARRRGQSFSDKIKGTYHVNVDDTSWTLLVEQDIREGNFFAMTVSGGRLFAANTRTVFRLSTDRTKWDTVRVGMPENTSITSFVSGGDQLLLGTSAGGYLSSDAGVSWEAVNTEGIAENETELIFTQIQADTVYAVANEPYGDASSLYRAPLSELATSLDNAPSKPITLELRQNYPNPFNPVTTIRFNLPQSGHTRLVVYDLPGREVKVLKDGWLPAGQHKKNFDGSQMASGVYFYRLESRGVVKTRKMILMK